MGLSQSPQGGRRFRRPSPGDEVDLCLRQDLPDELGSDAAPDRVHQLRARGIDRLRVRVVKAPRADVLTADDAVKVRALSLASDMNDAGLYVRVEFLDLPAI